MAKIFQISITELIQGRRVPLEESGTTRKDTDGPEAVDILLKQASEQMKKYKKKDFTVCILGVVICILFMLVLPAVSVAAEHQFSMTYDVMPVMKFYILRTIIMLLAGMFIGLFVKKTSHSIIINILEFVCIFIPAIYMGLAFFIYWYAPQLILPALINKTNVGPLSTAGCIIAGAYIMRLLLRKAS